MRIFAEIRNVPGITVPKLAERLKAGRTTVDKGIAAPKKNRYIERAGPNKSGYWKVLK